ncbi:MAG: carboxylate-amine ligase [Chitinophagaceae bacterium]|nr:carboxylate-amine ligase [Chitinophagaceae bacterium]
MDTVAITTTRKCFNVDRQFPPPGSEEEKKAFHEIQQHFSKQYEIIFPDKLAPRTVVILPSFSLDQDILSKINGAVYYEERLLCLLMLLRMPLTKVIYITSMPVSESIVDYYLHLLPGITGHHARQRLTMLSCYDASAKPLTQKVLERPRLIERIRQAIPDLEAAHLTCFNITSLEKTLAVRLDIPLFGTDPDKFYEGSKSGGRKNFRESGVDFPDGFEDLSTKADVIRSLAALKIKYPALRKAVVKMNDGFSGDGNAVYTYPVVDTGNGLEKTIEASFSQHFNTVAKDVNEQLFFEKFQQMQGIVEEFLEGDIKMSPSVQCVISPSKQVEVASTHDQLLGGDDGQIFLGAIFPADEVYSVSLAGEGRKIAQTLAARGALGRFAIDFISVKQADDSWKHYAIEINLRKGGTTHPFLMLQFLTDGKYNADTGEYLTAGGNRRFYFASDNVSSEQYKGLTPEDLMDLAIFHDLMYDSAAQEGVMFHLVGALSEFGKLGLVCVGSSPGKAKAYYDKTLRILDMECS